MIEGLNKWHDQKRQGDTEVMENDPDFDESMLDPREFEIEEEDELIPPEELHEMGIIPESQKIEIARSQMSFNRQYDPYDVHHIPTIYGSRGA